eukprot:1865538-Pleurochrysis_carterae.AAC.1
MIAVGASVACRNCRRPNIDVQCNAQVTLSPRNRACGNVKLGSKARIQQHVDGLAVRKRDVSAALDIDAKLLLCRVRPSASPNFLLCPLA